MADLLPESESPFDLPRPEPPVSWSERMVEWAESLDLTPTRLVVGVVVLAVGGLLAWRLLAPPDLPPEMELPFASSSVAPAAAGGETAAGGGGPGSEGSVSHGPALGGGRPEKVVVHVAGAVRAAGVQRLPGDARVVDAVEAAGGATGEADLARINLAALLEDGQQVYVPRLGEPLPAAPVGGGVASGGAGAASGTGTAGAGPAAGLVNINQATLDELDELPGVGPAIAQAIIDHREQQGPFTSVDQLLDVRGIGDAKLAELRDLVTV